MDYSNIFPKLWVGSCPRTTDDIDQVARETRLSVIFSLVTDDDIDRLGVPWMALEVHCRRRAIELVRRPVIDGNSADLRQKLPGCVRLLDNLLAAGHVVFLHCVSGIERAPSVAVAYLHWCLGYKLEDAEAFVIRRRGSRPDTEAIRLALVSRSIH